MDESELLIAGNDPVRVLMVEDSEDDAMLVRAELKRAGVRLSYTRVMGEAELKKALREESWDIILSDNQLPRLDARGVLRVVKELGLDIPVIVVSGTLE